METANRESRSRPCVIEVVMEVVNKGGGRSFLASLSLSFNTGVVTLVRSLLISFVL